MTRVRPLPPTVARAAAVLLEATPGALKKRNQALAKAGRAKPRGVWVQPADKGRPPS